MKRLIPYAIAGAVAVGAMSSTGCVVRAHTGATVTPAAASAELVYVSPGVWVVADYHEPVFYHGDAYWLYRGGYWYRSSYYSGGWVRVRAIPPRVRRIHRPRTYVRYRARPGVRTRRAPARRGPAVRDHRRTHRRAAPPPKRVRRAPARRAAPPPKRYNRGKVNKRRAPPPRKATKVKAKRKSKGKVKKRDHRDD